MLIWVLAIVAGLTLAILASRRAVVHLTTLAAGSRIPPFFLGITLVAIGTDLPEIANSIASSVSGHGDLNVGDSVGSAATQITLVLGLFPFFAGLKVHRNQVALIGGVAVISLAIGAVLFSDGYLSRADAGVLILAWLMASLALWRQGNLRAPSLEKASGGRLFHTGAALAYLALVGVGATLAVMAFVKISAEIAVPEYIVSFFAASLGTSLPELFVDITAIRKGEQQLAIGGIFGASMVDSTLSVAVGPLIAPTAITAELAIRGSLIAMGAVLLATLMLVCLYEATHQTNRRRAPACLCSGVSTADSLSKPALTSCAQASSSCQHFPCLAIQRLRERASFAQQLQTLPF
jgi:cation:H+ antiporter